jgi:hypothetical protein
MSTLRAQAMQSCNELQLHLEKLREHVRTNAKLVKDAEAQIILTTVQTLLMSSGNEVANIRATLSAAATCGQLRGEAIPLPHPPQRDHAMRAANDHTTDPDEEDDVPL